MKIYAAFLASTLSLLPLTEALGARLEAEAPIVAVTVFPDRAQVFRAVEVTLPAGATTLAVGGLPASLTQSIIYGNAGGDALAAGRDDVLNVDPRFCGFYSGDFTLCENSPALPDNNAWGVQVGRYGEGCPPCDSPVDDSTWGVIKALYR